MGGYSGSGDEGKAGFLRAVSILYGVPLMCLDSRSCYRKLHFKVLKTRLMESICSPGSSGWASCRLVAFWELPIRKKIAFKEQDIYAGFVTGFKEDEGIRKIKK